MKNLQTPSDDSAPAWSANSTGHLLRSCIGRHLHTNGKHHLHRAPIRAHAWSFNSLPMGRANSTENLLCTHMGRQLCAYRSVNLPPMGSIKPAECQLRAYGESQPHAYVQPVFRCSGKLTPHTNKRLSTEQDPRHIPGIFSRERTNLPPSINASRGSVVKCRGQSCNFLYPSTFPINRGDPLLREGSKF